MRDIIVTVVGNVGADPVVHETSTGRVTNFNLCCSSRVLDRQTGEWSDGSTTWFRIACWSALGANVAESIRRGERVIVTGKLKVNSYELRDGGERTTVELAAINVGHDLTFGTTRFTRVARNTSLAAPDDAASIEVRDPEDLYDLTGEMFDGEPMPA